jgi:hypothetical protein
MSFGRKNKFKAVAVTIDGIRFASKKEAARYVALKILQKAGEIKSLEIHPRHKIVINGKKICTYVADFRYIDLVRGGYDQWEDVKGYKRGPAYNLFKLKQALMFAVDGIEVVEL